MLLIIGLLFAQLFGTAGEKPGNAAPPASPKYHIQLLTRDTKEYFGTLFENGARDAAQKLDIYAEFVAKPRGEDENPAAAVEMAVHAGVDGIVLTAADSAKARDAVKYAKENKLSVLTYENENYALPNMPTVGVNRYNLGTMAGEMALKASGAGRHVALILPDSNDDGEIQYKNLIVQGVLESFSKSNASPQLDQILTVHAKSFESEKILPALMEDDPEVDQILCMEESITPGIAQSLVDNNQVGRIQLIGYGLMPQTVDYIRKGVIYGTVCPDAYEIGYESVRQLCRAMEGQQISDSISTDLYTLKLEDLKDWKEPVLREDGKSP